jgi:nucleoside 2-deoxyribosyltransferase
LLAKGWSRVKELRDTTGRDSRSAFVALRFLPEILDLWQPGFEQAISDAGYKAERSGIPDHNQRIDAEIIVQIKRARFVVADSTFANPGVYFEAGYALALGLPVIWTCRRDRHKEDMHFDTRQYNHILWTDAGDLKRQLTARILATI